MFSSDYNNEKYCMAIGVLVKDQYFNISISFLSCGIALKCSIFVVGKQFSKTNTV